MAAEQGLPSPGIRLADPAALLTHIEVPNQVKDVIMDGPDRNSDAYYTYLDAVDRLNGAVRFIEEELRNGRYLIAKAMENVKADFHGLLADSSLFPDLDELREAMLSEESPDQITPPEMIAEAALPKLHAMARRLVENGCASDCTRAYKEKREAALRRNFQRAGGADDDQGGDPQHPMAAAGGADEAVERTHAHWDDSGGRRTGGM
ncbi:hypothetical protein CLOP_g10465 [Closterium sp. NIES-67]|nr:hypothetical protein CLOP_g10465 [Closterium sp. NIES-67]